MKPARASGRNPSKGPNVKNKKAKEKPHNFASKQDQEHEETRNKTAPKRKAEGGSSSVTKKRKAEENWSVMPTSSIKAVENIMDLSILATLALRQGKKKESQEHLNIIKNRFLAHCTQLKIPVQKQKVLVSSQHHQEETKKSVVGKKTLSSVEGDLKAIVSALETMEEKTMSLQQSCNMLRSQLEAEEEQAEQILQLRDQAQLKLLPVPSHKDKTSLQKHHTTARPPAAWKLGGILQKPEAIQNAKLLLLQVRKHAERLFNPPINGACSSEEVDLNL